MKEENTKDGLSIHEILPREVEDFLQLPLKAKIRMLHFMVALVLVLGLFNGANFQDVQIVIAQSGSNVVYKKVAYAKEEKPQATDLHIANAIRAINGKGKPLNEYQLWLGACCLLSWKYDYPRNLNECCERINTLPLEGVEYICKYENIRKLAATNRFVKEDARYWDTYKPKDDERNFFNGCLSVSQALDTEIQKQIALDEG